MRLSKEEVLAAKYPRDLVVRKMNDLYDEIRGTGTGGTAPLPDVFPTWIRTETDDSSGSVGVTVNFVTDSPVEQKVYLTGQEAELIKDYAREYIGEPLTTTTAYDVHETMKHVILHRWASDMSDSFSSPHRHVTSSGDLVDTYYNPYVSTDSLWKHSYGGPWKEETRAQKFLRELKNKQAPMVVKSHRNAVLSRSQASGADFQNVPLGEVVALHLLRKMISQDAFRNYLRRGIVSVTGPSGLVYAVVRRSHLVEVYRKGKLLSTLCVYLKDKTMPPTDEVVAKMIIIECNEHDIWRRANINWKGVPSDMRVNVNRNNFKEDHLVQLAAS